MKFALLLAAAMLPLSPVIGAPSIEGNWKNPSGAVTVRIGPCGDVLCGRVTAASPKARADAAAGGTERLVGAELMSDLEQTGEDSWHGTIFVPDLNRRAEADLRLTDPATLDVQGCALGGLLCRSQQWTRVAPPRKPVAKKRR